MIEVWSREKVADADLPAFLRERHKEWQSAPVNSQLIRVFAVDGTEQAVLMERQTPAGQMDARDALLVRMARMLGCGHELVREIEADATENHR